MEMNQICPECGETHIKSLGYNYDLGRVFYECSNCEGQGDEDHFADDEEGFGFTIEKGITLTRGESIQREPGENERFSVAVFESEDDSNAEVIEGGLQWEDALDLASEIHKAGNHYGVEIIDDDPDNMEPIVWIKTSGDSTGK